MCGPYHALPTVGRGDGDADGVRDGGVMGLTRSAGQTSGARA